MSTRVRIHTDGAITVHVEPHWLFRLFGAETRDFEVEWNGATWVGADDGIPVSYAVHRAIERAVGR